MSFKEEKVEKVEKETKENVESKSLWSHKKAVKNPRYSIEPFVPNTLALNVLSVTPFRKIYRSEYFPDNINELE